MNQSPIPDVLSIPLFFQGHSGSRDRSQSPDSGNDGTCLHFSGLHMRTQERDIEELCSEFGKVRNIKLVTDPRTGESRGFAFVNMETAVGANSVIESLDGRELDGRKLTIQKAKRKLARPATPGQYLGFGRKYESSYGRDFRGRGGYDRRFDDRRRYDNRYDDRRDDRRYDDRRYEDRRYEDRRRDYR